ncbi:hypothetical protein GCM10008934_29750 [Virgibacillus salarius]
MNNTNIKVDHINITRINIVVNCNFFDDWKSLTIMGEELFTAHAFEKTVTVGIRNKVKPQLGFY